MFDGRNKLRVKTIMKNRYKFLLYILCFPSLIFCVTACMSKKDEDNAKNAFYKIQEQDTIQLFTLKNGPLEAGITNYGGRLVSLLVPDRDGIKRDVVLGFDKIDDYLAKPSSYGAVMGRVTNRVDRARIVEGADTIRLEANNGEHSIHGGSSGWRQQVFSAYQPDDSTLRLAYRSPDGEGGYPGTVEATVIYTLMKDGLRIDYEAETDRPTYINLTNHSFFNLDGNSEMPVLDYVLQLNASRYTPVDSTLITTGSIESVAGTPFDFLRPMKIKEAFARNGQHQQLRWGNGLDLNFVLDHPGVISNAAAKVSSGESGIRMEVFTTEPGLQVYLANSLDGTEKGKGKKKLMPYSAICLETQHYPDAPNKPHWPSTRLLPGKPFHSTTIYRFH